jgi:Anti-sigma-K factor rskA/Putative zinc-finger
MKPALSHEEAFAELDAVAFDLLDTVEREAIMQHVATCPACRAELDALQETAAELAFATPSAPNAAGASRERIRERLLARVSADAQSRKPMATPLVFPRVPTPPSGLPASPGRSRTGQWLAIAAGVLFVASLGLYAMSLRDRQEVGKLRSAIAAAEQLTRTADSLTAQLAARDSVLAGIAGRDVTVMTLTSQAAKDPYARMFWDRARHTWTLIAHNMPALKAGRTYQLWLVTPNAKISAGTFAVRNGDAVVRATYDLTEPLNAIAVTDEPAGGVPQPTGPVVIAAQTR